MPIHNSSTIHPNAVIDEKAIIGKNCKIGPFCYVSSEVVLEDNFELFSHVSIVGKTFNLLLLFIITDNKAFV